MIGVKVGLAYKADEKQSYSRDYFWLVFSAQGHTPIAPVFLLPFFSSIVCG